MKTFLILLAVFVIGIVGLFAYPHPLFFTKLLNFSQANTATFYKGTLPSADCPGIDVTLTLWENGTYDQIYRYRGKSTSHVSAIPAAGSRMAG
jgi:hypothetical protein